MITDAEKQEPKSAFNARYGAWMREMRAELGQSLETVSAATGVGVDALHEIESGRVIELYDAMRLCKYFGVDE